MTDLSMNDKMIIVQYAIEKYEQGDIIQQKNLDRFENQILNHMEDLLPKYQYC